jgi:hypothetical protein
MIETITLFHNADIQPLFMFLLIHRKSSPTDMEVVEKDGGIWGKGRGKIAMHCEEPLRR